MALANTYRIARMPRDAKRCLARVSPSHRSSANFKELFDGVTESIEIIESISIAEEVLGMVSSRVPFDDAKEKMDSMIRMSRMPFSDQDAVLDLLARSYRVALRVPDRGSPVRHHDFLDHYKTYKVHSKIKGERPRLVFTCGFLWSGSGAVTDMLRGVSGFELAASGNELRLFKDLGQPGSLLSIFDAPVARLGARQIMGLILGPVLGLHSARKEIEVNRNRALAKAQWDSVGNLEQLWRICHILLDKLESSASMADQAQDPVLQALQWFAQNCLQCLGGGDNSSLVLNNSIFGFRVRLLALFSDAMAITVMRDPRDQYVAEYYERAKHRVTPIDAFIRATKARRDEHDRSVRELGLSDRVIELKFEDFVQSDEVRRSVLTRLGVDAKACVKLETFDPARSRKNIGIYKNFPDQALIRRIEEAFPELTR